MNRKFLYLTCVAMLSIQGTPTSTTLASGEEEWSLEQLQNLFLSEEKINSAQDKDDTSSQTSLSNTSEVSFDSDDSSDTELAKLFLAGGEPMLKALQAMQRFSQHPKTAHLSCCTGGMSTKELEAVIKIAELAQVDTEVKSDSESSISDNSTSRAASPEDDDAKKASSSTSESQSEAPTCNHTTLRTIIKTGGVTALLLASGVYVNEALQEHSALYAGGAGISALGAYFLYQSQFSIDPSKNSVTENLALGASAACTSVELGFCLGAPLGIAARSIDQYYKI